MVGSAVAAKFSTASNFGRTTSPPGISQSGSNVMVGGRSPSTTSTVHANVPPCRGLFVPPFDGGDVHATRGEQQLEVGVDPMSALHAYHKGVDGGVVGEVMQH